MLFQLRLYNGTIYKPTSQSDNEKLHSMHGDACNMSRSDINYNRYQNNDYNLHDDLYDPFAAGQSIQKFTGS